jgi:nucleoside-diphosphate-sugar epimerase
MRYYITGASGFIGKHMVKHLEGQGHEVICITRNNIVANTGIHNQERDKNFVFINLAAYGNHYNQRDIQEITSANIIRLFSIIKFCQHENCNKFYNISTSAIQLPTDTLYSVSKRFGELMVESYNDSRFVNIRPYSVYGPGEAGHRFIPTVIRALHSGETIPLDEWANHDWIYIDDFIEAMFKGYTMIGAGITYGNIQIVRHLEDISGKKLNYEKKKLRSYDTDEWLCQIPVPHRSIKEGLKQTYEWFTQKNLRDKQEA